MKENIIKWVENHFYDKFNINDSEIRLQSDFKDRKHLLESLTKKLNDFEKKTKWGIIPEKRLKTVLDYFPKSTMFCQCGHFNENIIGMPYAYDAENNDTIYAYKCQKCGNIMYTRD